MKKTILLVFILSSFMSIAQKVSYTYYFNDPTKLTKEKVYLDVLTLGSGGLGAGVHGYFQPVKNLSVNGLFRYCYLDFVKGAEKASTNEIKSTFHGEANAQFQFASKVAKKERKTGIIVAGNATSKTTVKVPAKKFKSYSVRGGLMMYRNTIVGTKDNPFKSNGLDFYDVVGDKNLVANETGTCVFVGYTGRRVKKVGIDADGYGKRRAFLSRFFFMDAIIGGTVLSDVQYNNLTFDIKDTKRSNVGYRVGWEWEENGTLTRFEMGNRPGFNSTAMPFNYVMLTFGFRVYGKEKFIFTDNKEDKKN